MEWLACGLGTLALFLALNARANLKTLEYRERHKDLRLLSMFTALIQELDDDLRARFAATLCLRYRALGEDEARDLAMLLVSPSAETRKNISDWETELRRRCVRWVGLTPSRRCFEPDQFIAVIQDSKDTEFRILFKYALIRLSHW